MNPAPRSYRFGRFYLDRDLVETQPEVVRELMRYMVVVRCECLFAENRLEFMALSPHFGEVPLGGLAPLYTVTVHEPEGIGLRTFSFK